MPTLYSQLLWEMLRRKLETRDPKIGPVPTKDKVTTLLVLQTNPPFLSGMKGGGPANFLAGEAQLTSLSFCIHSSVQTNFFNSLLLNNKMPPNRVVLNKHLLSVGFWGSGKWGQFS